MDTIAKEARTRNVSQAGFCRYCANGGYVVVVLRRQPVMRFTLKGKPVSCQALSDSVAVVGETEFEELGPCPFCQRGFFEEFGDAEHQQKAPPVSAPWRDGFWKGRAFTDIQPLYGPDSQPLPPAENGRRMRELLERMAAIGGSA